MNFNGDPLGLVKVCSLTAKLQKEDEMKKIKCIILVTIGFVLNSWAADTLREQVQLLPDEWSFQINFTLPELKYYEYFLEFDSENSFEEMLHIVSGKL